MARSETMRPTQMQQDRLIQLGAAVSTATRLDRSYLLKSDQYRKVVKGFALGAYRELKSEGLEVAANLIILQSTKPDVGSRPNVQSEPPLTSHLEDLPRTEKPEFNRERLASVILKRIEIEKDFREIRPRMDATVDPILLYEQEYDDSVRTSTILISVLLQQIQTSGDPKEVQHARETIGFLATYLEVDQQQVFP